MSPTEMVVEWNAAWDRRDLDALMRLMGDDPAYRASIGPDPGATHRGRDAVRRGLAAVMAGEPAPEAGESSVTEIVALGDRVVSKWHFTVTGHDGAERVVEGVDLWSFDTDGRIREIDAYRKALDD